MIAFEDRVHLLRKLLQTPEELRHDLLQVMRESHWTHEGRTDRELLAQLDREFYSAMDAIPGMNARDLAGGYWSRSIAPLLLCLRVENVDDE